MHWAREFCFNVDICSGNPESHEEPSNIVDDLNGAENGEAGEESHGAANQTQLGADCYFHISLNVIVSPCVKVDLYHLQGHSGNCAV